MNNRGYVAGIGGFRGSSAAHGGITAVMPMPAMLVKFGTASLSDINQPALFAFHPPVIR